jgi:Fe-S-cluster containining protein
MTPAASPYEAEAARDFSAARDPQSLATAVVVFHRRMDEVMAQSLRGHAVEVACKAGCGLCCHMRVEAMPAESFHLAAWLRRHLEPARLEAVLAKLRHNVAVTLALGGADARKRANLACALLDHEGRCIAYAARPAQCRRYHSTRLATCEQSHAHPEDLALESAVHPASAHNGAVIVAQARRAQDAAGLDAAPQDLNVALLEALVNPKAWRRWRDGKKAFI